MEINFDTLFVDGGTALEIYLCDTNQSNSVDVLVGRTQEYQVRSSNTITLKEFYYRDITCSYDTHTDAQRIMRRSLVKDYNVGNLYIAVFKEEQVPAYYFPTTMDMSTSLDIQRKTMRLNNRLSIINDTENMKYHYLYLRYSHSDNVDTTKIKHDINQGISKLVSFA